MKATSKSKSQAIRTALILAISVALVVIVTWFVPSLSAASTSMLFRLRGEFKAPDDIVVLAIDDQSLQRIGRWPWPRSVMAGAIDQLSQAKPRAIGLDIIYAEPSAANEDQKLISAIAHNGHVILPAQLYESSQKGNSPNQAATATAWLRPLPELANAAKAIGHAHVSPEVDGTVRSIQLSKADDRGHQLWAFGLEVVREADQIPMRELQEQAGSLRLGSYQIPVRDDSSETNLPGVSLIRQNEMLINYAGPARSFRYYSMAELIDRKVPLDTFTNKIVLIGAAAESMGDTRVVPFMHYGSEHSQGGQEMPGVEIHANIINTIRGRLSFHSLPDWMSLLAALVVIIGSTLTIIRFDGWRQILFLGLILLAIIAGSFFAFSRFLIIPPLVPMLTGFVAVIPLLLNRSLAASRELDDKLAALVTSQQGFLSNDSQPGVEIAKRVLGIELPQSLDWKLRAVDDLTIRLLARMSFINRILSSMAEGVLVTDLAGRVVFANREVTELFGSEPEKIIGAVFADLLIERGVIDGRKLREAIENITSQSQIQIEFEIADTEPRYFSLLLSALATNDDEMNLPKGIHQPSNRLYPINKVIGVVVIISDITKRVELDRMKTETLQLVSHELRTPLTSIQSLSDVLIKFPVPDDEAGEMLSTIHSEAVRLGETINRYLDLTRLESGVQSLHLTQVSCQQLINDCVRNIALLAAEQRIRLTTKVDEAMPPIQADAQLLTQAINNLLSNAIKYSSPNTEVTVTAEMNQSGVIISVRDQGFGIPEEAREKIFQKFYRLERDSASGAIGTGLGLPLVKEIVEQHGGRITVESILRTGSTFKIHLPLQPKTANVAE